MAKVIRKILIDRMQMEKAENKEGNMNFKKLIVAKNEMDLFLKGYYRIEKDDDGKFDRVVFCNSVFTENEKFISDAYKEGYRFNCGYIGHGPRNLVSFLQEQTGRSESTLNKVVFQNDIIEFNFLTQEIEAFNSNFPSFPIEKKPK